MDGRALNKNVRVLKMGWKMGKTIFERVLNVRLFLMVFVDLT